MLIQVSETNEQIAVKPVEFYNLPDNTLCSHAVKHVYVSRSLILKSVTTKHFTIFVLPVLAENSEITRLFLQ